MSYTDLDIAYLAGMLDGDGSIDLRLKKGAGTLQLRAQVYNTDQNLMEWLQLTFGGNLHQVSRENIGHHWRAEWTWYNGGQPAVDILKLVEPYLIVKKVRAGIAIEAWEKRQPTPRGQRHLGAPSNVVELRQGYVDRMREHNAKGIPALEKGA